jgi:hypothetical protein
LRLWNGQSGRIAEATSADSRTSRPTDEVHPGIQFRDLGFIEYNGDLKVNTSLLSVVLHD